MRERMNSLFQNLWIFAGKSDIFRKEAQPRERSERSPGITVGLRPIVNVPWDTAAWYFGLGGYFLLLLLFVRREVRSTRLDNRL